MNHEEKRYATNSPEEDFIFKSESFSSDTFSLKFRHYTAITVLSIVIIGIYLIANTLLYPNYPILNKYAEQNEEQFSHYPPFRMNEWHVFSAAKNISPDTAGTQYNSDNMSPGFPFISIPFINKFGTAGFYFVNAFVLWLSALFFFSLTYNFVGFSTAIFFTFILAFASPNFFFAASGYPEPLAQLLILIAVYTFVKGYTSEYDPLYILSGFALGLNLFIYPVYVFSAFVFAWVIFAERNTFIWKDTGILHFAIGLGLSFILFFVAGGSVADIFNFSINFSDEIFSPNSGKGTLGQFWNVLFGNPDGIIFVMPATLLTPLGLIIMWRKKLTSLCTLSYFFIGFTLILMIFSSIPMTGESVSARNFIPVLPFMIFPLIFVWQKEKAEKVWISAALIMSFFICSTAWWIDLPEAKWLTSGAVHDNGARYILLARNGKLKKPVFKSSNDMINKFYSSLKNNDIKTFLGTLDLQSLEGIRGQEREFYSYYSNNYIPGSDFKDIFIEDTDADKGIRLVLPTRLESIDDTLNLKLSLQNISENIVLPINK